MKSLKKHIVLMLIAFICNSAMAQNVLDGVYIKEHTPERTVIPYTPLREADVAWNKRIWRTLDLREKINHPLYFPTTVIKNRRSLTQVIMDGITIDGTITPYEDDEFIKSLTKAEILASLTKIDTLQVEDPDNPGAFTEKIVPREFDPGSVVKYRLKEDWFFDKQRSVLDVRIVGICPVQDEKNDDGSVRGSKPMFWCYFPECRYVFVNAEVFNRDNDAERRTLQDIFWKRMFGSYIRKESNVYDRAIIEYKTGMDALLEAEVIKEKIFFLEHDLWEL